MTYTKHLGRTYNEGSIGYELFKDNPPAWLLAYEANHTPYQIAIRGFLSTALWQIEGYQGDGGTHWVTGESCDMTGHSNCLVRIRRTDGIEEHSFSICDLLGDIQSGQWRYIADHKPRKPKQLELFK